MKHKTTCQPTIAESSRQLLFDTFINPFMSLTGSGTTVYAMAGIPGAGKSTFVRQSKAMGHFPRHAFVLNPDEVMEALPEYKQTYDDQGAEVAFQHWELPTRDLSYEMLEVAIQSHLPIIIDMGAARPEHYNLLCRLKEEEGYLIEMHWLDISVATALERIKARSRFTPESMLLERKEALAHLIPQYKTLVNDFFHH